MATTQRSTVVGVFETTDRADRAVQELRRAGFRDDQIGYAVRGAEGQTDTAGAGSKAGEGLAAGAVIGGIVGAAAALLIPGIGPVIAGGVLASVLGGAAVGAAAGGILGALVGMGIPEEEASYYESEFQAGRTLVTVRCETRCAEALEILRRNGAYDVETRGQRAAGMPATAAGGATRFAGQLRPGMRVVGSDDDGVGEVKEVRGQDFLVDRAMQRDVYVPFSAVQDVAGGRVVLNLPAGRVDDMGWPSPGVGERTADQREAAAVQPSGVGRWDEAMPRYRGYWQQRHGAAGRRWEEAEPAYRFAYEARSGSAFRNRPFDQAEAELRRDWQTRYPNRPWEEARENVREAWEGGATVELREEQLTARKESVQTGQVEVGKRVVEEQRTVEVPVTREEVTIERQPVNRPTDKPVGADADTIRVPVREERVEFEKRPVVREEVSVEKRPVTETEPHTDTVRREEAVINRAGAASSAGFTTWDEALPQYRSRWQQRWGANAQERWEDWEPRYRFGWEMANRPEYRGRSWSDVESQAQKDWEMNHRGTPWDRAKEGVRDAWESVTGNQVRR